MSSVHSINSGGYMTAQISVLLGKFMYDLYALQMRYTTIIIMLCLGIYY